MRYKNILFIVNIILIVTACTGCRKNNAKREIEHKNIPFSADEFVHRAGIGDTTIVRLFLSAGINPDVLDISGRSALNVASFEGKAKIVELLLQSGANVNLIDSSRTTALLSAALALSVSKQHLFGVTSTGQHEETIEQLLKAGANPNVKNEMHGLTPLMIFAKIGEKHVLELLLSYGAAVNAENKFGMTALLMAKQVFNQDIVELLKKAGAIDINVYDVIPLYQKYEESIRQSFGEDSPAYVRFLVELANIRTIRREYKLALDLYQKASLIQKDLYGEKDSDFALSLHRIAAIYLLMNDTDKYKQFYEKADNIYVKIYGNDKIAIGNELYKYVAPFYDYVGIYDKAKQLYYRILAIREEKLGGAHKDYLECLKKIADISFHQEDYVEANNQYNTVALLKKELYGDEHPEYLYTLNGIIKTYDALNNYEKADSLDNFFFDIVKNNYSSHDSLYVFALRNRAERFTFRGQYQNAIKIYKQIINIEEGLLDKTSPDYAELLENLADVYLEIADFGNAEQLYQKVISIQKTTYGLKHEYYARALSNLARLYIDLGDYIKAEALFKEVVSIYDEVYGKGHRMCIYSLLDLSGVYINSNKIMEAIELLSDLPMLVYKRYGQKNLLYASVLNHLAVIYMDHPKHLNEAISWLEQALKIATELLGDKNPQIAVLKSNLATCYSKIGKKSKSEHFYLDALSIIKETEVNKSNGYINTMSRLAYDYAKWQRPANSLLINLENIYAVNSSLQDMALWATEQQQQLYAKSVEPVYDYFYSLIAQFFFGESEYSKKIFEAHLNSKSKILDALSQRNRFAILSKDPKLTKKIERLKYITRQIANLTFNSLGNENIYSYKEKISQLEQEKEELEKNLARGSAEYAENQKARQVNVDDLAALLPKGSAYIDFASYEKYDYITMKNTNELYYIGFSLTKDESGHITIKIRDLGPTSDIDPIITKFRQVIQNINDSERGIAGKRIINEHNNNIIPDANIHRLGKQLYQKVLSPFEPELISTNMLFISPDGNLCLVPFEIFTMTGKDGFLCQYISIEYVLGRDLYAQQSKVFKDIDNKSISIIAAPNFDMSQNKDKRHPASSSNENIRLDRGVIDGWPITFDSLPGTLTEAYRIKELIVKYNLSIYHGDDASENIVKDLHAPGIVHIATHGFFLRDVDRSSIAEEIKFRGIGGVRQLQESKYSGLDILKGPQGFHNPLLRSGLALAGSNRLASGIQIPANEDDGILTAMEVTGLDFFGTELIVLSACETGLGEVQRGQGVVGLRRAFRIAGAKSILMSLWNVPDKETVWLMEEFYKNYFQGKSPLNSLQIARVNLQQKLIERDGFAHPFYWAAFILEGTSFK